MSILFYRRPDYVDKAPGYLNDSACQRYVDRTKGSKHKAPIELSFDNILNNRTLPPTTLGDFMVCTCTHHVVLVAPLTYLRPAGLPHVCCSRC